MLSVAHDWVNQCDALVVIYTQLLDSPPWRTVPDPSKTVPVGTPLYELYTGDDANDLTLQAILLTIEWAKQHGDAVATNDAGVVLELKAAALDWTSSQRFTAKPQPFKDYVAGSSLEFFETSDDVDIDTLAALKTLATAFKALTRVTDLATGSDAIAIADSESGIRQQLQLLKLIADGRVRLAALKT